jgi:hypothetical protein
MDDPEHHRLLQKNNDLDRNVAGEMHRWHRLPQGASMYGYAPPKNFGRM